MLAPAFPYQKELNEAYSKIIYNPRYKYWNFNNYWNFNLTLSENSYNTIEMVSIDDKKQIRGFLSAEVNRCSKIVTSLGVMNFSDEIDLTFSKDFGKFITDMFNRYNFFKVHFSVVVGNPAEKMYDKFIQRYGGEISGIFKQHTMLEDGKLYDVKHYDIFKTEFDKHTSRL